MAFWSQEMQEPLRQNRWFLRFSNAKLSNLIVALKECSKPAYEISVTEHRLINHTFRYPGVLKWNNVTFKVISTSKESDSDNDSASKFYNLLKDSGYSSPSSGYGDINKNSLLESSSSIDLIQINGDGKEIEEWKLYNPFFSSVNFGTLSYSSDELVEISVTLQYDWAELSSNISSIEIITGSYNPTDIEVNNKSLTSGSFVSSSAPVKITEKDPYRQLIYAKDYKKLLEETKNHKKLEIDLNAVKKIDKTPRKPINGDPYKKVTSILADKIHVLEQKYKNAKTEKEKDAILEEEAKIIQYGEDLGGKLGIKDTRKASEEKGVDTPFTPEQDRSEEFSQEAAAFAEIDKKAAQEHINDQLANPEKYDQSEPDLSTQFMSEEEPRVEASTSKPAIVEKSSDKTEDKPAEPTAVDKSVDANSRESAEASVERAAETFRQANDKVISSATVTTDETGKPTVVYNAADVTSASESAAAVGIAKYDPTINDKTVLDAQKPAEPVKAEKPAEKPADKPAEQATRNSTEAVLASRSSKETSETTSFRSGDSTTTVTTTVSNDGKNVRRESKTVVGGDFTPEQEKLAAELEGFAPPRRN